MDVTVRKNMLVQGAIYNIQYICAEGQAILAEILLVLDTIEMRLTHIEIQSKY